MKHKSLAVVIIFLFIVSSIGSIGLETKDVDIPPVKLVDGPMDSAWPMYGHDAQNTCLSEYNTSQNQGYEKWKYFDDYSLDFVTPVIDNEGTLYVSSGHHGNGLHAIYPNGTSKWHSDLIGTLRYQPVIGLNGAIYVGTSDRFHAFYPNGTLQWILPMEKSFRGQPVVSPEGIIYVGTRDGYLYAVYPNGTIQWEYYLGYSIIGASLDAAGNIYFTAQYCDYLYSLNPNGTLRWAFETIQKTSDAPLIGDDGTIYTVPVYDVIAINPDGTEKWRIPTNGNGASPALSPDGTIVYSSFSKDVFGLNPENGHIQWHYQLDFNPGEKTRPAISSDGTIFFAYTDEDGDMAYLSALNPDGTLKWTTMIASDIYPYDGIQLGPVPSIDANGTVYTTSWFIGGEPNFSFGYVHAFGQLDPNAPSAPAIMGPAQGTAGVQQEYTFTSTSPTGNDLHYFVLWGDDTYTNWTGPFPSGEPVSMNYTWSEEGTYTIRAKAMDISNDESNWGTLTVTMPVNQHSYSFPLLQRLLERFPNMLPILRFLLIK